MLKYTRALQEYREGFQKNGTILEGGHGRHFKTGVFYKISLKFSNITTP